MAGWRRMEDHKVHTYTRDQSVVTRPSAARTHYNPATPHTNACQLHLCAMLVVNTGNNSVSLSIAFFFFFSVILCVASARSPLGSHSYLVVTSFSVCVMCVFRTKVS